MWEVKPTVIVRVRLRGQNEGGGIKERSGRL